MLSAVCFDFDGTLAHYTGDFPLLLKQTAYDLNLSETETRAAYESFGQHVRREGRSTLPGILRNVLHDLGKPDKDVTSAAEAMTKRYLSDMALLPGAEAVLELTRHLPRALITNGPSDMQRAAVRHVGLEDTFQTIIVSGDEDVAVRKPNRHIFELACERLGTEPENTLMVGDNLEADIRGALAYGMQAVWLGEGDVEGIESVRDTAALYEYFSMTTSRQS